MIRHFRRVSLQRGRFQIGCDDDAVAVNDIGTLRCPISAFGGERDLLVTSEAIALWNIHTDIAFKMRMMPGDHFFINTEKQALLAAISTDLKTVSKHISQY